MPWLLALPHCVPLYVRLHLVDVTTHALDLKGMMQHQCAKLSINLP